MILIRISVADHRPPCIEPEVIHEGPNRIAAAHGQHGANFSGNIVLCPKMEHEEAHDFQHSLKALIAKLCGNYCELRTIKIIVKFKYSYATCLCLL